jgi:hypothetical protein
MGTGGTTGAAFPQFFTGDSKMLLTKGDDSLHAIAVSSLCAGAKNSVPAEKNPTFSRGASPHYSSSQALASP